MDLPTVKESPFYERIAEGIRCTLCHRHCLLREGEKGFCKTRVNKRGRLYTLVFGDISALEARPIEIKPFFHFYPGSHALTLSTWSCNFTCPWCQNWRLSRGIPNPVRAVYLSPERIVREAIKKGVEGICVSFQEPTLLTDYCLKLFPLAKEKGLYNTFVSNGYMTSRALKALREAGLDAINIDMKGDEEVYKRYCSQAKAEMVWENIGYALELGVHVEVVNLVISGVNDADGKIRYVIENLLSRGGREVPLHFTRYYPAYRFKNPPTPVATLEKAYRMAREAGVLYPYLGNVPGHSYESTYCPGCGELLIERIAYRILRYRLKKDATCPACGFEIKVVGKL